MSDSISIRTLKIRQKPAIYVGGPESRFQWFQVLLVFSTSQSESGMSLEAMQKTGCPLAIEAAEYKKTECILDLDKYQEYLDGYEFSEEEYDEDHQTLVRTVTNTSPYKREDVVATGYRETLGSLSYIEKFGVYVYRNYVTDCATTRGALQDLQALAAGYNPSRTVPTYYLCQLLEILNIFWD